MCLIRPFVLATKCVCVCAWDTVHALDLHFIKNKKKQPKKVHVYRNAIEKHNFQITSCPLHHQATGEAHQLDHDACHLAACCLQGYQVNSNTLCS